MAAIITEYAASDYDEVWALHQDTVKNNAGFVKNMAFHADMHDIPNAYEVFYVMREAGNIIGTVGLKRVDGQTLEIKRLQVIAAHQDKGFGRMLMERAMDYARECGVFILRLDVSEPQVAARDLYLAMGFQVTRVEARTLGPDQEAFLSTYMEKEL